MKKLLILIFMFLISFSSYADIEIHMFEPYNQSNCTLDTEIEKKLNSNNPKDINFLNKHYSDTHNVTIFLKEKKLHFKGVSVSCGLDKNGKIIKVGYGIFTDKKLKSGLRALSEEHKHLGGSELIQNEEILNLIANYDEKQFPNHSASAWYNIEKYDCKVTNSIQFLRDDVKIKSGFEQLELMQKNPSKNEHYWRINSVIACAK